VAPAAFGVFPIVVCRDSLFDLLPRRVGRVPATFAAPTSIAVAIRFFGPGLRQLIPAHADRPSVRSLDSRESTD
jgi:hypothetical protein